MQKCIGVKLTNAAYRKVDGLSFGLAIEALKKGKKIARKGWNGRGMFLFLRPEALLPWEVVKNAVSLPECLRDYVGNQPRGGKGTKFGAYICMKAADESIVNGWLASQTDMLADDWTVIE